jgi:hypothetical protein
LYFWNRLVSSTFSDPFAHPPLYLLLDPANGSRA